MAGRIVPGGLGWTETHHEFWLAMQRAHRHYKRTAAILESITGSHATDVSLPTGAFEYEMAAERQRVAFENYIESRMQFSESLQVGFENYAGSRIELSEPLQQTNAVATKAGGFHTIRRFGRGHSHRTRSKWALIAVTAALLGAIASNIALTPRERQKVGSLNTARDRVGTTVSQIRNHVQPVEPDQDRLTAPQPDASRPPGQRSNAKPRTPLRRPLPERRLRSSRSVSAAMPPKAAETAKRPPKRLNGIIARNHHDLVQLEGLGQRNYYEFTLTRSRRFAQVGPLLVSLRVVNPSRGYCGLTLMAGRRLIDSNPVRLYRPVWISAGDPRRTAMLVVYSVDRHHVKGYISVPKYEKPGLLRRVVSLNFGNAYNQ